MTREWSKENCYSGVHHQIVASRSCEVYTQVDRLQHCLVRTLELDTRATRGKIVVESHPRRDADCLRASDSHTLAARQDAEASPTTRDLRGLYECRGADMASIFTLSEGASLSNFLRLHHFQHKALAERLKPASSTEHKSGMSRTAQTGSARLPLRMTRQAMKGLYKSKREETLSQWPQGL